MLEERLVLSSPASTLPPVQPQAPGPDQHVLILSVDGLHQADVTDPNLAPDLTNILKLQQGGVAYTNASTSEPSDSFPGTLSYLTGAGPATTGVYYDDSYSRTLFAPGTTNPATATPGTEVQYAENIDKNSALLSGGGNFNATSIDPTKLPVNSQGQPVYPNQFLQVNTIFDVAHQAGLYTAFSDKHPAYQIAAGNDPNSIDDQYSPEVNANAALLDPTTNKTVNADALLTADPFTDVSKYTLVDASTDPLGASDPNLEPITNNVLLTEAYDDLKVRAILNEIGGKNALGTDSAPVPNLFGMNFQAVSVAQKFAGGGIAPLIGDTAPSLVLQAAMQHTDSSVGKIVAALQNTRDPQYGGSLWNSTDLILTAKHGQDPRVGAAYLMADSTLPNLLSQAGAPVAQATQDDVSLLWLKDQGQTSKAVQALQNFLATGTIDVYGPGPQHLQLKASQVIDKILSGPNLVSAGLGNPAQSSTTPDIIVTLKPGFIWVSGNPATKFTYKRAEHGGFSEDDTHIPLIVSGGALPSALQGTTQDAPVQTTQIAVTALNMLGLSADRLQGVVIEGTKGLPGLHVPQNQTVTLTVNENDQVMVGAFNDSSTTNNLNKYKVAVQWRDDQEDQNAILIRDASNPHIVDVWDRHTYDAPGIYDGTVVITPPAGSTTTETSTA
ncbi:MAG: alkaline phosphatase family protein, partial [Planctomycetaceae bacterium]|nr:alkaline phosphatase family protein [Planctomycetaceae bacterium]